MNQAGARAPKYHRVADQIRRQIETGTYKPGEQLPAETDLAKEYEVSLPTIRQAFQVLRAEGLIESRHGIGTFVRQENRLIRISRARYGRARADRQLLSSKFRHEITSAGKEGAPPEVADAFDIKPGDAVVVRRRRLTDEDGRLVELAASYLPTDIAAGTLLEKREVVPKALFLCVEDLSGRRYTEAHDKWVARMPNAVEAVAFDLPMGAPVMHLLHVARDENGKVLEVCESTWSAHDMVMIDDYEIEQKELVPSVASDI